MTMYVCICVCMQARLSVSSTKSDFSACVCTCVSVRSAAILFCCTGDLRGFCDVIQKQEGSIYGDKNMSIALSDLLAYSPLFGLIFRREEGEREADAEAVV